MKVEELRIGNFLLFENEAQEVSSIHSDSTIRFKKTKGDKCHGCYHVDAVIIKPIPLTEAMLLRFGFDLINNEYHQSRNHDLKLHWTVNKNKMIPEFNKKRFVTGYDFKYVHQLQNLYFALTGEELICK